MHLSGTCAEVSRSSSLQCIFIIQVEVGYISSLNSGYFLKSCFCQNLGRISLTAFISKKLSLSWLQVIVQVKIAVKRVARRSSTFSFVCVGYLQNEDGYC